jgi:hypothetical protein
MMDRHAIAIAKTVLYASLFDYPLTLDQVHDTLLGDALSREQIFSTLAASPELRSIVEHQDGFFFPAGRRDLIAERARREARSRQFLRRHDRLLRVLCALPFTRMVALSGSIAHLNLEESGDLDLFIVTRGRAVWTVAFAIVLLTRLLGVRRVVCANFVMSDEHLGLEQQDLFTANQVIHLKPLVGEQVFDGFLAANAFVHRFYPNRTRPTDRNAFAFTQHPATVRAKRAAEVALQPLLPAIDAICRRVYSWHLHRRSRSWRSPDQVALRSDYLKLHTQSHRGSVLHRFEDRVDEALRQGERAAIA